MELLSRMVFCGFAGTVESHRLPGAGQLSATASPNLKLMLTESPDFTKFPLPRPAGSLHCVKPAVVPALLKCR